MLTFSTLLWFPGVSSCSRLPFLVIVSLSWEEGRLFSPWFFCYFCEVDFETIQRHLLKASAAEEWMCTEGEERFTGQQSGWISMSFLLFMSLDRVSVFFGSFLFLNCVQMDKVCWYLSSAQGRWSGFFLKEDLSCVEGWIQWERYLRVAVRWLPLIRAGPPVAPGGILRRNGGNPYNKYHFLSDFLNIGCIN